MSEIVITSTSITTVTGTGEAYAAATHDILGDVGDTSLASISASVRDQEILSVFDNAAIASKLQRLRTQPFESFEANVSGNADRFAALYGDRILAEVKGKHRTYYVAGRDNLWRETTGDVGRMCDAVSDYMRNRARELAPDDLVNEDEESSPDANADAVHNLRECASALRKPEQWRLVPETATDRYNLRVETHGGFNSDSTLLSLADGKVLVLGDDGVQVRSRELTDMCTLQTTVTWNPEILLPANEPPEITEFIDTFIQNREYLDAVFTRLGTCLRGGNIRRQIVIIIGGTTCGKSQLMEALSATFGQYVISTQQSVLRSSHDDKPRPDIIRIYDARLALFAEASSSWKLSGDRIKMFTGGDADPQRGMRSDHFHDKKPMCTPVIYTNEAPKIIGADAPLRRRVCAIKFGISLPPEREDPRVKERFVASKQVHEWLLAKMAWGYMQSLDQVTWLRTRDMFAEYSDSITREMSPVSEFIDFLLGSKRLYKMTPGEMESYGYKNKCVLRTVLHAQYVSWIKATGSQDDVKRRLGPSEFMKELTNWGFQKSDSGGRRWDGWVLQPLGLDEFRELAAATVNNN
jgi:hypothetical protein